MIARFLILLIRAYQLTLSPLLGNVCRFHPSCSRYGLRCIELHGAARGSWLTLRRLSRCHPFHPGGYDPPPLPEGHPDAALPPAPPAGSGAPDGRDRAADSA
jgi:putative membrane protein insertion efficiency factor